MHNVFVPVESESQPNLVFIMSDDHAAHAISAYGSRINHTPTWIASLPKAYASTQRSAQTQFAHPAGLRS